MDCMVLGIVGWNPVWNAAVNALRSMSIDRKVITAVTARRAARDTALNTVLQTGICEPGNR